MAIRFSMSYGAPSKCLRSRLYHYRFNHYIFVGKRLTRSTKVLASVYLQIPYSARELYSEYSQNLKVKFLNI